MRFVRLTTFFIGVLLAAETAAETRLRIVAGNITSGTNQSYTPGDGERILRGLKPDIVLIQEFKYMNNTKAEIDGWVAATFGPSFVYFREPGVNLPNGVISRYPIKFAGVWDDPKVEDREFVWAVIDVPGEPDLWAISVHFKTKKSAVRNTEGATLIQLIQKNIPEKDYVVLGGDFNTDSRKEAVIATLSAVFETKGPYPVDGDGKEGTNASRQKPYDWVLADEDLHAKRVSTVIGSRTFPNGLVFDSRVFTPLTDVAPVQRGDSGAQQMQHMAVVRDFVIP